MVPIVCYHLSEIKRVGLGLAVRDGRTCVYVLHISGKQNKTTLVVSGKRNQRLGG